MPTLTDILAELAKPGRDPRQQFEVFAFQAGVEKMEDLKPGMKLPGIVTNVTAFGAFVDIISGGMILDEIRRFEIPYSSLLFLPGLGQIHSSFFNSGRPARAQVATRKGVRAGEP